MGIETRKPNAVRILSRNDIAGLLLSEDYFSAVEQAYRLAFEGNAHSPVPLHLESEAGTFHAKGAILASSQLPPRAALKFNANFPSNPKSNGLPTIQGALLLSDAADGRLLAVMDSAEITTHRTAAASAIAASLLSAPTASTLGIIGCGEQGWAHAIALSRIRPIKTILVYDEDQRKAESLIQRNGMPEADYKVVVTPAEAARSSEIIATCTPARSPVIDLEDVTEGTFIAAVGADNPEKNEIGARLVASAVIVADTRAQCVQMGDTRAAIAAGLLDASAVYAEIGELLFGDTPRPEASRTVIYDSTGTALQDVTCAIMAFEIARERDIGLSIELAA